ncbi:hypothetical protein PVAND_016684 [Polypedilum vanderplanki]|uniref:Uncharacterized protein n=1 Tax=Polypedilum vanderplanki TaxID=319348 RepID=A0A9J6BG51_POLVA|nr:hypothetical protein PVAND_016684 [Polypedilum vanderplanki]
MEQEKSSQSSKKSPKSIDCTNCKYKCSKNFPEHIREKICESFWNLKDYRRQKDFILANVKSTPPKRRRPTKEGAEIKRTNSKIFHLRDKRVCQSFFLKTLSISNGPLIKAFQYKNEYTNFFDSEDRRGKHEPSNKIKPEIVNSIVIFLTSKCIAEGGSRFKKKVISDTSYKSLRNLFNDYHDSNNDCPSYTTFKRIFHEHNFSLPQERLKTQKNPQKIEIQGIEILNAAESEIVEEIQVEQQQPKVIVTQVPESSKFIQNQPEVYEIQFIPIQTINSI